MSDLINRADAIEEIRRLPNAGIRWFVSAEAVFDVLLSLPSAEPKHGHWDIEISADGYQATYHCSECGHQFKWVYDPHFPPVFNYCQKCGARMEADHE